MAKTGLLLLAVIATFVASMLLLDAMKGLKPTEYQREKLDETQSCIRTTIAAWKSIGLTPKQRIVFENFWVCAPLPPFLILAFCLIRKNWNEQ